MREPCPCGSGREYFACCGPVVSGAAMAPTAEALMRSRYTAYVKGKIDHILGTYSRPENADRKATEDWSRKAEWKGLSILRVEGGRPEDSEGVVEFSVKYEMAGQPEEHRETAYFVKKDGVWLYDSGDVRTETVVRPGPKVGRNDPCPCGSGKKYKHCCGK